jgi:dTDP-4-amino-4,6-dideoxygalactose transaminase
MRRYRAEGCRLCASGTHALQIALSALSKRTDNRRPVLLPAFTCYEVATAAVGARSRVALYDLDPVTLQPDWDAVRAAGRQGAAALVVAPLFGMPIDWEIARRAADLLEAPLLADVAQAHGATWLGAPAGSTADVIVLSFGRGKGWTGAGGGALLWRGAAGELEGAEREGGWESDGEGMGRDVSTVVAAASQFLMGRSTTYGIPAAMPFLRLGETVYHAPTSPRSMSRSSAALLLANDEASLREVLCRRNNAAWYSSVFRTSARVTALPGGHMDDSCGALRYPLRVRDGWAAVRAAGAQRLGAAPTYPTTLQELTALAPQLVTAPGDLPGARLLARELVTLPTHSRVTDPERRRLVELLAG